VERRISEPSHEETPSQRSYTLALVILACVIVMLVSGGIILFVMAQP